MRFLSLGRSRSGVVTSASLHGGAALGDPEWLVDPETFESILPPLDLRAWVCVVPPPPPLSGSDDLALVRSMSRAWYRVVDRHAVVWRRGRRRPVVSRKHRHFASIVQAIRDCIGLGISGEAYQLAAWWAYPDSQDTGRPHPFTWSMVPKCRVRFLEEAGRITLGGRLVATPALRDLCNRHHHASARFVRERPDEAGLRAIVAELFPGDLFRRLRAAAHREAAEAEAKIRREIDDGGWPW